MPSPSNTWKTRRIVKLKESLIKMLCYFCVGLPFWSGIVSLSSSLSPSQLRLSCDTSIAFPFPVQPSVRLPRCKTHDWRDSIPRSPPVLSTSSFFISFSSVFDSLINAFFEVSVRSVVLGVAMGHIIFIWIGTASMSPSSCSYSPWRLIDQYLHRFRPHELRE